MLAKGFDEGAVHGAHGIEVLLDDRFGRAPAFGNIPGETAGQPEIGIGIDENFEREKFTKMHVLK